MSTVSETPIELFTYNLKLPSGRNRFLLSLIGASFIYFPLLVLSADVAGALILTGIVFAVSIYIGRFWARVSSFMVDFLVIQPLRNYYETGTVGKRLKYFFGENPKEVFLQYEVRDLDLAGIIKFMKNSVNILIPFTAILALIWNYLFSISGNLGSSLSIAFLLSFFAVGFYFPTSMVLEDARIMTIRENGMIEYSANQAKNVLDGLFKITGIISGYSLLSYAPEMEDAPSVVVFLVYILLIAIVLPISYPILFNSLVAYFKRHNQIVNDFRMKALSLNIPIKKTAAVDITPEELESIALGASVETKEIKQKKWGFIPWKVKTKVYDQEKLDKIKFHGGWVCKHCLEVGGTASSKVCKRCGKDKAVLEKPNI